MFADKLNPKIKRAPSSRELDPCEGVRPWHSLDRGAKLGSLHAQWQRSVREVGLAGAILQHHKQDIAWAHSSNRSQGTVVTVDRRQPEAPRMQDRKPTNALIDDTRPARRQTNGDSVPTHGRGCHDRSRRSERRAHKQARGCYHSDSTPRHVLIDYEAHHRKGPARAVWLVASTIALLGEHRASLAQVTATAPDTFAPMDMRRRGPWLPLLICGVCFTIGQSLQIGWMKAGALALAAAGGGALVELMIQWVRRRRLRRRQQQHPYWLP
jgi:hypothetical protein